MASLLPAGTATAAGTVGAVIDDDAIIPPQPVNAPATRVSEKASGGGVFGLEEEADFGFGVGVEGDAGPGQTLSEGGSWARA